MPRGRKSKKNVPRKEINEETEEIQPQIQHDEGGDDLSVALEGEEEMGDINEVGEGLDDGRQTMKKRGKKSCHLKNEEEEALVLEWIEANPLLWNSKDKEFKNKSKKDRLWVEQAEGLNYDGEFPFIYLFICLCIIVRFVIGRLTNCT